MKEFKYTITDPEGIHARPAGELIKTCKAYSCNISIAKGDKKVDCKKIFAVMGLGVKKDMEITLTFDGADEDAAYEAVSKFLQTTL
ncbi:MAG: HPr family phosphocarrier protein [Candidatus Alectryocaccobium sp.]|jgi:phosphocarrier protein HPr